MVRNKIDIGHPTYSNVFLMTKIKNKIDKGRKPT